MTDASVRPAPLGLQAIHIKPTAELAERVLLPGDPGRALALAQTLIERPIMFNHNRGLWGYSGPAKADGDLLTIQATGMGAPSAAIVLHELIELGGRRFLRVGTCGAFDPQIALGDLVVAREVIVADGTSPVFGAEAGGTVAADVTLCAALEAAAHGALATGRAVPIGTVVTTDVFYEPHGSGREADWIARGALAVEMEAAALFAVAARAGARAGCLLFASDQLSVARERISEEGLAGAAEALGEVAVAALGR